MVRSPSLPSWLSSMHAVRNQHCGHLEVNGSVAGCGWALVHWPLLAALSPEVSYSQPGWRSAHSHASMSQHARTSGQHSHDGIESSPWEE